MLRVLRLWVGITLTAPITLIAALLYVLPFWLLRYHRFVGVRTLPRERRALGAGLVWVVDEQRMPQFLLKRWTFWGGHCVGSLVVLRRSPDTGEQRGKNILNHELHHVHQFHTWGPLFPLMYALSSLTAWMAGERVYMGNHFEVAARRASGQIADAQSFTQGFAWCKRSLK